VELRGRRANKPAGTENEEVIPDYGPKIECFSWFGALGNLGPATESIGSYSMWTMVESVPIDLLPLLPSRHLVPAVWRLEAGHATRP